MSFHGIIVLAEWILLSVGVIILLKKDRSLGCQMMAGSLAFQALGGIASFFIMDWINQNEAYWLMYGVWALSTLVFCSGFVLFSLSVNKKSNQTFEKTKTVA